MSEHTFGQWLETVIIEAEDFVLGVDVSTRDGDSRHDDWAIEGAEARFAAKQIAYCLQVLESLQLD